MCRAMPRATAPCSDPAALHCPSAVSKLGSFFSGTEKVVQADGLSTVSGLRVTVFRLKLAEQAASKSASIPPLTSPTVICAIIVRLSTLDTNNGDYFLLGFREGNSRLIFRYFLETPGARAVASRDHCGAWPVIDSNACHLVGHLPSPLGIEFTARPRQHALSSVGLETTKESSACAILAQREVTACQG